MRPRSRLSRHNARTSAQQAVIYVILSVLFVAAVLRFGVPAFIQGVSWMMGKDSQKVSTDLSLPPQAPALGDLPEATFSSQIKVSGLSQSGLKIRLSVNGSQVDEIGADSDGSFSFNNVALIEGVNQITAVSINSKNVESAPTNVSITVSKSAPKIEITNPHDGDQISGIKAQSLTISGKVDQSNASVRINDNYVSVGGDGGFNYSTRLNTGDNNFAVRATSVAGISTEISLKVTFSP